MGSRIITFTVLDTPGINNLTPNSEDEKVTRDILLAEENYSVLSVLDAKNLNRGLTITLQLIEMGLPLVLVINMVDEARSRGMEIQPAILEEILGVKVLPTVATRKKGWIRFSPTWSGPKNQSIVSTTRLSLRRRWNSWCP